MIEKIVPLPPSETTSATPNFKAVSRNLWAEFGAAHAALRTATERAAGIVATVADEQINDAFDLVEATDEATLSVWPNYDYQRFLPPSLFGPLSRPARPPKLPRTNFGRNRLINRYSAWQHNPDKYEIEPIGLITNYDIADYMPVVLQDLADQEATINPDQWNNMRSIALAQARRNEYDYEFFLGFRLDSVRLILGGGYKAKLFRNIATGFADKHVVSTVLNDDKGYYTPADFVTLPIVDSDVGFTSDLVRATRFIQSVVDLPEPKAHAAVISRQHESTLLLHTARARTSNDATAGFQDTIKEGAVSVAQAMAMLTAEVVDGYTSREDQLHDVVSAGLVEQFTRAIPMGFLAPTISYSAYIPGLVVRRNNKLGLNRDIIAACKEAKQRQMLQMAEILQHYKDSPDDEVTDPPDAMGLVCPAAMPKGAIEKISNAILRAMTAA